MYQSTMCLFFLNKKCGAEVACPVSNCASMRMQVEEEQELSLNQVKNERVSSENPHIIRPYMLTTIHQQLRETRLLLSYYARRSRTNNASPKLLAGFLSKSEHRTITADVYDIWLRWYRDQMPTLKITPLRVIKDKGIASLLVQVAKKLSWPY